MVRDSAEEFSVPPEGVRLSSDMYEKMIGEGAAQTSVYAQTGRLQAAGAHDVSFYNASDEYTKPTAMYETAMNETVKDTMSALREMHFSTTKTAPTSSAGGLLPFSFVRTQQSGKAD